MPEEKKLTKDKIEPLEDLKDVPAEEAGIPSSVLPLQKDIPQTHDRNIHRGTGGRYLSVITDTTGINTDQTSYQDFSALDTTVNVYGRRVLLLFSSNIYHGTANGNAYVTFDIDGTDQGVLGAIQGDGTVIMPICIAFVTGRLQGSHTFKVQFKSDGNSASLGEMLGVKSVFSVIELSD